MIEIDLAGPKGFDLSAPHAGEKLSRLLPEQFNLVHLAFPFPGTMTARAMASSVRRVNFTLLSLNPRPQRTLFISSTAVYSPNRLMDYSPWEIYGHLKWQSEIQLAELGGFSILRPGTLIDANRRSAIATLYLRALSGKIALLPNSGALAHPFLHVDDLVAECVSWCMRPEIIGSSSDLWASEPVSALEYLRLRSTKSRIVNLPGVLQGMIGCDAVPLFGISKWHMRALSYDVSGRNSGSLALSPPRTMAEIFGELLSGSF